MADKKIITIIGSGQMGSALAFPARENGNEVRLNPGVTIDLQMLDRTVNLVDERIDAVIAQDPGHAVRSALRIMRARSDHRELLASQERIRIEVLLKENLQFA